jgi:hypothetical protein
LSCDERVVDYNAKTTRQRDIETQIRKYHDHIKQLERKKTIRETSNQLFVRKVLGPTGVLQMNIKITLEQIQPLKLAILKKLKKATLTKVK